ncbi:MAG: diphosphate--fructose-6-phosphate 1-phosphotransferase [Gemmatimonadetes bacterium]|nr:diphosphate--fructose-6-phosphate 1-phosphotransferase [Gemmatimonadota bacterium]
MSRRSSNNALILQAGGGTRVVNRSLWGLVDELSGRRTVGAVYGAVHGVEGVLDDELIDLGGLSASKWARIAGMPAAALGTSRHRPADAEMPRIFETLRRRRIRFLFMIGGNDTAATGHRIVEGADAAGLALSVVMAPKTIDNDLLLTDHTPGYGSAARFVALATLGAGLDGESLGETSPVTIMEVMGRDAGWLAASAALVRREERDAPHVLGLPEVPVDEDRFVGLLEDAYRRFGSAVAVVAENTRSTRGVLGGGVPVRVDPFGHPYHEATLGYLGRLATERLGVRVREVRPGTIQRSYVPTVSHVDAREAEEVGRAAVRQALEGRSDCIVTLVRSPGEPYACATGSAPLARVADAVRQMPPEYLDPDAYFVTERFAAYARPLIGRPLPRPDRLI